MGNLIFLYMPIELSFGQSHKPWTKVKYHRRVKGLLGQSWDQTASLYLATKFSFSTCSCPPRALYPIVLAATVASLLLTLVGHSPPKTLRIIPSKLLVLSSAPATSPKHCSSNHRGQSSLLQTSCPLLCITSVWAQYSSACSHFPGQPVWADSTCTKPTISGMKTNQIWEKLLKILNP